MIFNRRTFINHILKLLDFLGLIFPTFMIITSIHAFTIVSPDIAKIIDKNSVNTFISFIVSLSFVTSLIISNFKNKQSDKYSIDDVIKQTFKYFPISLLGIACLLVLLFAYANPNAQYLAIFNIVYTSIIILPDVVRFVTNEIKRELH